MYRKAYDFVLDILNDAQINDYIHDITGKHLAIINAGAQVSAPSAQISFLGGRASRKDNTSAQILYSVDFWLPLWSNDAFSCCIDFVDFIIPIFFDYRDGSSFILQIEPSIHEPDELLSQLWRVQFSLTLSIFL